jgi:hypothetical protein
MGTDNDTDTSDTDTDDEPDTGNDEVEKWKRMARKHEARAKAALAEIDKVKADAESANRSDLDKLQSTVEDLRKDLAGERRKTMVAEIAAERGLSAAQAKRLSGTTREELESDADDIVEAFGIKAKPAKGDDDEPAKGDTNGSDGDGAKPPAGKPKEKLRPGAAGDSEGDEIDPDKIAEKVLGRHRF